MGHKFAFVLIFLTLIAVRAAFSQISEGKTLDKIVAVVGDEIIMQSDINAAIAIVLQQNQQINPNDPSLRKQILDNLINTKLIVAKAIEDSIVVTDEEVNQYLDYWLQEEVRRYGSEKRLEDIYGISISRLKFEYRDDIRKRLLAQRLQQKMFASIVVSPKDMEEFYRTYKDSLPDVPDEIELYHLVKDVETESTAKQDLLSLVRKVRDSIISSGDFSTFAKRYSDDAGTKEEGGNLGWFDKGKLYPEFEKAAFALQPGEISLPVETPFGFHIIQTIEKKKDAINTRHILFKIGQTGKDIERTKETLLDYKKRTENGESFEELAKKYSDDKETKGFGGFLGRIPISEVPSADVRNLKEGEISQPLLFKSEAGKSSYHIVLNKKFHPSHKATLETDYKQIERFATMWKQQKQLDEWIAKLRKEIFWVIKE